MYSYPNHIPVAWSEIERIAQMLANTRFDRMYGAFPYQQLTDNVHCLLHQSMERYKKALPVI